jgi:hypothetical protein
MFDNRISGSDIEQMMSRGLAACQGSIADALPRGAGHKGARALPRRERPIRAAAAEEELAFDC